MIEVGEQAPVVAASEIEIAAAPQVVWDVLTRIDRWSGWNPQVKSMSMRVAPAARGRADVAARSERWLRCELAPVGEDGRFEATATALPDLAPCPAERLWSARRGPA
jgi:hypothetical protein